MDYIKEPVDQSKPGCKHEGFKLRDWLPFGWGDCPNCGIFNSGAFWSATCEKWIKELDDKQK